MNAPEMKPAEEILLVATREVKKNLRGVKGIILLALSLLGGTIMSYLFARYIQADLSKAPPDKLAQLQGEALAKYFHDDAVGRSLADAPFMLVIMLVLCVWLAPALIWLAGFDGISGEIQHRTIRYWWVRVRRWTFYVGKVVGLFLTVAGMTFAMHFAMWVVAAIQGSVSVTSVFGWGFKFWVVSLPIVAAWCGVASLVGSATKTPISSLLLVGFTFFTLFILGWAVPFVLVGVRHDPYDSTATTLRAFYPNSYDRFLLSTEIDRILKGLLGCGAFAVLPTAGGAYWLSKRDV
ncbi:MAG: ABC transporter permease [Polyangiaceae bacterium]